MQNLSRTYLEQHDRIMDENGRTFVVLSAPCLTVDPAKVRTALSKSTALVSDFVNVPIIPPDVGLVMGNVRLIRIS